MPGAAARAGRGQRWLASTVSRRGPSSWRDRRRDAAPAQTPNRGLLTLTQREDLPQGFAIHETSTISTVWPAMPCFSNLVLFDPLKATESADTDHR